MDNSGKAKWTIVINYRKLNQETIDDKFPILNIESISDKLGRAQYFCTLNLAKGFHQINKDITSSFVCPLVLKTPTSRSKE